MTNKKKKPSKERGENYLIKIRPSFLFNKIDDWENDEGLDKDGNPTQEATDYCIVQLKALVPPYTFPPGYGYDPATEPMLIICPLLF